MFQESLAQRHSDHTVTYYPTPASLDELITQTKNEIPVITPEFIKSVHQLDALGSKQNYLGLTDTIDIVGVVAGIKPACIIRSGSFTEPEQLEQIITGLGLDQRLSHNKRIIYVSRRPELSLMLAQIHSNVQAGHQRGLPVAVMAEQEKTIGKLLGYPKSATEMYIDIAACIQQGLPNTHRIPFANKKEWEPYAHFVTSQEHWQQELAAYSMPLKDAVKTLAPMTYHAIPTVYEREILPHINPSST